MKIAILGYSGSGKSTLARTIGEKENIPVLHLDRVHHLPGWQERSYEEKAEIIGAFLREHESWVIDGNYSKDLYWERLEQADRIILLEFNRFSCFYRAHKRFMTYKGTTRADMGEGCQEKFDWEFAKWILWQGRTKRKRDRHKELQRKYPEKMTVFRNQKQLDAYIRGL